MLIHAVNTEAVCFCNWWCRKMCNNSISFAAVGESPESFITSLNLIFVCDQHERWPLPFEWSFRLPESSWKGHGAALTSSVCAWTCLCYWSGKGPRFVHSVVFSTLFLMETCSVIIEFFHRNSHLSKCRKLTSFHAGYLVCVLPWP